ncbi:MAG: MoxR family ATPase [Gammaproteobacteria bacterium]|nr:MoxR family ATPase [Gammaproteobacteria bacterium]NNM00356.1 MoxR family ATPase [Gammaproteobacteria bacterium]
MQNDLANRLVDNINTVIRGQAASVRMLAGAFLTGGHVLLEDYPGTGKTTLAKALAKSLGLPFQRVQFTPDLLPNDIIGISVYNQKTQSFELHKGPVFTSVLLADEINRASPRTQSALLEAMGEAQVSLDGVRHELDEFFFVVATQNPIEFHGTYPLPEAQMDRFAIKLTLGYVPAEEEVAIISAQRHGHPVESLEPCATREALTATRSAIADIRISEEVSRYIVEIVSATRRSVDIALGASPRASLALSRMAQALACFDGSEFVLPEHVQQAAGPVIAHRIVVAPEAGYAGTTAAQVVTDLLTATPVPR